MEFSMEYSLTDLCDLIMGQSPDSSSCNKNGNGIPFYQGNADFGEINPIPKNWCTKPKKTAIANDILISVRAPIGDLNIANEECCIGRGVAALRIKNNKCNKDYLFLFLESKSTYLQDCGTGSTFKAINKGVLEELKVKCPAIDQQAHIADEILNIKKAIKCKNKELLCLNEAIQSEFVEMFGEPHDNKTFPYKLVGEFTTVTSGGTPERKKTEYWKNGTIPWVKTTELQNNEITEIEEFITQKGLDESSAKIVPAGTLLIAMYGQGKTRGMTGYLGIEASTNQACACILPSTQINQKFLWYYFILSYDKLRDLAKGGNQPNLNGNMIKSFPVLWPPLELQNEYVRFVQQIDKSKFVVKQQIADLQELLDSKMQEYFS